jgi:hypothetical protein
LYQNNVISGNCLKIFPFLPIVPYGALQVEIIADTGQWQMDKKTQKESESRTEWELSTDADAASDEKAAKQNAEILEDVANEPERIDSEIKAPAFDDYRNDDTVASAATAAEANENYEKIAALESADTPLVEGSELPEKAAGETDAETDKTGDVVEHRTEIDLADTALTDVSDTAAESGEDTETDSAKREADQALSDNLNDDLETGKTPSEAREDAGQKSEEPATEGEHKTSKFDSSSGHDAEATEIGDQSDHENNDHDEKEADSVEKKTGTADTDDETGDFAQGTDNETPAGKISALKVTVSAIIITAAFSGFFFFGNNSKIKATSQKAAKTSEKREFSKNSAYQKKMIKPLTPETSSIYDAKIKEVTVLRDILLLKQEEVMRLKKQYQEGIEELEKEILDELQSGESNTFLQAMQNSSIAFALRAIQRRQAYIQQLERPSKWIHQACEELLYIKRRTLMDLQLSEIAAGIDMNKHMGHINAAVRKYQPAADKLAPDMTNTQLEPLEAIWERIQEKTQQDASVQAHSKNQIISEQICMGNFNRLTELSELSDETARCITAIQASDLFLNGLSEITPGAAKQLFHWKGSWICLNGVRALSPRAAHYLFQWDGNWISLNGLTEFPAEIGEVLLQWEGRQLELMGLQYREDFPARIALGYLARWERAGGKLFVPQRVREKIDEMNRNST